MAAAGGKALLSSGLQYARGDSAGAVKSLFSAATGIFKERQADAKLREENHSEADVVMWSGCKDEQTVSRAEDPRGVSPRLVNESRQDPLPVNYRCPRFCRR